MNSSELRIAFVSGTLQLGGSTTFLLNLCGEFARRGIDCCVYSGDNLNPLAGDFERAGISVALQDHRHRIFEDRIKSVLHSLGNYRPNGVVATLAPFSYEVLRYVPQGVVRLAMAQSDERSVYEVLRQYVPYTDGLIAVSAEIAAKLRALLPVKSGAIYSVPYGVHVPEGDKMANADAPLRLLYLGRIIDEQKRAYLFPEILAELKSSGIPFRWTIAGDGPERANLQSAMQCEEVRFVGAVGYSEIGRLLDEHDVFLLPSTYEGLPLSLLEAMAHGLVPVVSDLPSGVNEVVDLANGILVPVDDVRGYARAIARLHENRSELASKSSAARQRVVAEFSAQTMADRWLKLLGGFPHQTDVPWPNEFDVEGPIGANSLWFRQPAQTFRRLVKRFGL